MLDTGYDHKEIENLIMLRPTTSAIKYAQMRGRGSRLCPRIAKSDFLIYDFVNNTPNFDDPGQQYHRPNLWESVPVGVRMAAKMMENPLRRRPSRRDALANLRLSAKVRLKMFFGASRQLLSGRTA